MKNSISVKPSKIPNPSNKPSGNPTKIEGSLEHQRGLMRENEAAEILAQAGNMAVGAFPKNRLDEFSTFVRTHDEKVLQRCPCCFHITQGVKMIGNN